MRSVFLDHLLAIGPILLTLADVAQGTKRASVAKLHRAAPVSSPSITSTASPSPAATSTDPISSAAESSSSSDVGGARQASTRKRPSRTPRELSSEKRPRVRNWGSYKDAITAELQAKDVLGPNSTLDEVFSEFERIKSKFGSEKGTTHWSFHQYLEKVGVPRVVARQFEDIKLQQSRRLGELKTLEKKRQFAKEGKLWTGKRQAKMPEETVANQTRFRRSNRGKRAKRRQEEFIAEHEAIPGLDIHTMGPRRFIRKSQPLRKTYGIKPYARRFSIMMEQLGVNEDWQREYKEVRSRQSVHRSNAAARGEEYDSALDSSEDSDELAAAGTSKSAGDKTSSAFAVSHADVSPDFDAKRKRLLEATTSSANLPGSPTLALSFPRRKRLPRRPSAAFARGGKKEEGSKSRLATFPSWPAPLKRHRSWRSRPLDIAKKEDESSQSLSSPVRSPSSQYGPLIDPASNREGIARSASPSPPPLTHARRALPTQIPRKRYRRRMVSSSSERSKSQGSTGQTSGQDVKVEPDVKFERPTTAKKRYKGPSHPIGPGQVASIAVKTSRPLFSEPKKEEEEVVSLL